MLFDNGKDVSFQMIAERVVQLGTERANYVYPGVPGGDCSYVDDTSYYVSTPPCLWGQAMLDVGVPHALLVGSGSYIREVFDRIGIATTSAQRNWATNVQRAQDARKTWGKAVRWAGPIPTA